MINRTKVWTLLGILWLGLFGGLATQEQSATGQIVLIGIGFVGFLVVIFWLWLNK